jgi:LuxR family transcriptional regulator, maltose regulon positive regulatory protein
MIGDPPALRERLQPLATKILQPRRIAGLIDRPRLLDLFAEVKARRLVLVKAGAGFGKTSLVGAWADRLQRDGEIVAWLTLDAGDDEPRRFLFYIAHALQRACPGIGGTAIDLISSMSLVPQAELLAILINELAESDEDIYLVIDDFHLATDPEIHSAVSFLLTHAPAQLHLVIISRTEPPLPIAILRARNDLLEIDAAELRFDLEETSEFLDREKRGTVAPAEVRILYAKTEGWPAVLRIVASTSARSGETFGGFVRRLSGTLRPIGAYLAEMLDGLPPGVLRFMLRTSVLDRLSAPLCEAVAGIAASRDMLSSMEDRQLLLAPLDREGQWYRYHPLLGGYLGERLETEFADEIPELHRRAAAWYAGHELWTDAVRHAIAAGDTGRATGWMENAAMALVKQGDLLTLLDWRRRFSGELSGSQIEVRLAIAWGLALAMRFPEVFELLDELERGEDTAKAEALRSQCQAIRSVAIALQDDSVAALSTAQACLGQSTDPWTVNVVSNVVRFCHWKAGDLKGFYATPWLPFSDDEDRRNLFASVYRLCFQGLVEVQQLRLSAGERYYLEAMRLAERHVGPNSVAAAFPASLIAELRYEQGRHDEAEAAIVDRVSVIAATGMLECTLRTYLVLVRAAVWRGNVARAYALLERAEQLGHARGWGRLVAAILLERLRLNVSEGRLLEAGAGLDRLDRLGTDYPAPTPSAWASIPDYAGLARATLAAAERRWTDAVAILRALDRQAVAASDGYLSLRVTAQLAVALLGAGELPDAFEVFRRVLTVAAGTGVSQSILDQGREIGTLLSQLCENARSTPHPDELLPFADSLLVRWQERHPAQPTPGPAPATADALSPRERDILDLIGQGQTNKAIARALAITPETVKTHVKRIFVKLGVESRAQAVALQAKPRPGP